MLKGELAGHICGVEAVGRRMRGHNRYGALSVSAVKRLVQVCLLRLCGKSRGRTAALHVNYDKGKLGHHCKAKSL